MHKQVGEKHTDLTRDPCKIIMDNLDPYPCP